MRHLQHILGPLGIGAGRLSRDELLAVVDRIAAEQSLWRPVVRHDPVRRWYGRLHWSPNVEVWLLGWEHGQDTRLHDHGGSSGAFHVAEGVLGEEYGYVQSWTGVRRRSHGTGLARSFGPGYVHNLGTGGAAPATSVHAYSPPLSTMTYYRPEGAVLVPYETVVTAGPDEGIDVRRAVSASGYLAGADS